MLVRGKKMGSSLHCMLIVFVWMQCLWLNPTFWLFLFYRTLKCYVFSFFYFKLYLSTHSHARIIHDDPFKMHMLVFRWRLHSYWSFIKALWEFYIMHNLTIGQVHDEHQPRAWFSSGTML